MRRFRGGGTREKLEEIARDTGVFLVVGVMERADSVYVCRQKGYFGKGESLIPNLNLHLM